MAGEYQGDDRERMVESKYGTDRQGVSCGLGRTEAKDTRRRGKSMFDTNFHNKCIYLPYIYLKTLWQLLAWKVWARHILTVIFVHNPSEILKFFYQNISKCLK